MTSSCSLTAINTTNILLCQDIQNFLICWTLRLTLQKITFASLQWWRKFCPCCWYWRHMEMEFYWIAPSKVWAKVHNRYEPRSVLTAYCMLSDVNIVCRANTEIIEKNPIFRLVDVKAPWEMVVVGLGQGMGRWRDTTLKVECYIVSNSRGEESVLLHLLTDTHHQLCLRWLLRYFICSLIKTNWVLWWRK